MYVHYFFVTQNEATSLHLACMDNHSAPESAVLCNLLLDSDAKVNAADLDGHTALHFCCLYGLSESTQVLVSNF